MIKRLEVHSLILWWGCILLSFALPVLPRIVPFIIFVMTINWITEWNFKERFIKVIKEKDRKYTLILILLYVLYLSGLLYSENFNYAFFDLEVKLSLLIFPLILSTSGEGLFNKNYFQKIFSAFISGCSVTFIVLITRSFTGYLAGRPDSFYYTALSWHFHPSYLSMYFTFAIAVLFRYLLGNYSVLRVLNRVVIITIIVLFELFVFLLSAKAGIIAMIFVFVFISVSWMIKTKWFFTGFIILGSTFLLIWATATIFPLGLERLKDAGKVAVDEKPVDNRESTSLRFAAWKASRQIISEHYWLGVGTGDVKDELIDNYKKGNNPEALKLRLNAHSQFLQTFIAIGIPGIFVLLAMFLYPGWLSLFRDDHLYFLFLAIFAFNILVESMFETQAGVVFYAFFNTLFFRKLIREKVKSK